MVKERLMPFVSGSASKTADASADSLHPPPSNSSSDLSSTASAREGSNPTTLTRREHDDRRTLFHPIVEIDDILVGHAYATGRNGLADIFRLVGAVYAVQGILVALVKVQRSRAERIFRAALYAMRVGTEPRLNFRRRDPIRPFRHSADSRDAGPGHRF